MDRVETQNSIWLQPLVDDGHVAVEFRDDHVHVELGRGLVVNSETRNELWGLIGRLCAEHRTNRVLVEGTLPKGIFQTSEVIDAGLKTATVPKLWMAFHIPGFVPDELTELYETVAASRGVRVKFFVNRDAALHWLRTNTAS